MIVPLRSRFLSHRTPLWACIGRAARLWFILRRAAIIFGVLLTLPSLLSLLPWVDRCSAAEIAATAHDQQLSAPIFLSSPAEPSPLREPSQPHHHHVAPRVPCESNLTALGSVLTLMLLSGALLLISNRRLPRLISAPPTPPPRMA